MANESIPEQTRLEIVRRYKAGDRVEDIVAATGVSRAHVYYLAKREGIKPSQDALTLRVAQLEREVAELKRALKDTNGRRQRS